MSVAQAEKAQLPGFWALAWMLFMQPIALHERLKACGIEEPVESAWRLWRKDQEGWEIRRTYVRRMFGILFGLTPLTKFVVMSGYYSAGIPIDEMRVAFGVVLGVAFGVVLDVAYGVLGGVLFGLAFGLALGANLGVAIGVALGTVGGTVGGMTRGVAVGVAVGVTAGVDTSVTSGVAFGVAVGVISSMVAGLVITLSFLRLPLYFLEVMVSVVVYQAHRWFRFSSLRWTPVLYHDLSFFPQPLLLSHILLGAETDTALVRRVLDACARAPGQRQTGRRAVALLQARELEELVRQQRFVQAAELEGEWLPGVSGADRVLLTFQQAARYLAAAATALIPQHRRDHLERCEATLNGLVNQLRHDPSLEHQALPRTARTWQEVTADLLARARKAAEGQLENPFRPTEPLSPELGQGVFRGREPLVRQVEALLADASRSVSLALLGPRRCGKTSLLKMLPTMLPDTLCVFFDLQDNPVASPLALFPALASRALEQSRRDRRLEVPPFPDGPPMEAARRWLDELEQSAGRMRVLLCLDEFERLEELSSPDPESRHTLLQVMGLLRATIQHRRRVRLLVCGASPFDQLSNLWNDHFINAQELRIGHLDRETSLGLLTRPLHDYPDEAIPTAVAEAIYERTFGQPYLLQLYGFLLVDRLNRQKRRRAEQDDLGPVEEEVLSRAGAYFREVSRAGTKEMRQALAELAHGGTVGRDSAAARGLRWRGLLTDEGRLGVPVLGRWLREEGGPTVS